MVAAPGNVGVHEKVQLATPFTSCQVVPPSTEISTPTNVPPTSLAMPLMVTGVLVVSVAPFVGEVMLTVGAVKSVDAVAAVSPDIIVAG